MTGILTSHLVELVETLHELRLGLRRNARAEVARAIGEALRETTMDLICGAARYPSTTPASNHARADSWQAPLDEPWDSANSLPQEEDPSPQDRESSPIWGPALMAGLSAAHWSFARSRQIGPALLLGLVVVLAAGVGGPTLNALLKAWLATGDLLTFPGRERRP
jgi:hypothetical protein